MESLKSLSIQTKIGIAFVITGIILQFFSLSFFPSKAEIPWLIGTFLIFFAPYGQYGASKKKKKPIADDPLASNSTEPDEKWCDLTPEKVLEFFKTIENPIKDGPLVSFYCGESTSSTRKFFAAIVMFIGFIAFAAGEHQIGALLIDLYWIPRFITRLGVGNYKGDEDKGWATYAKREGAEQVLSLPIPENIRIAPQILMKKDGDDIIMSDIKFNISGKTRNPKILCSMITVSQNTVLNIYYPFNYFVVVVKGPEAVNDNALVRNIVNAVSSSGDIRLDASEKDGNSVFVVLTDSVPEYTTDKQDTGMILTAAGKIMELLEKY